MLLPRINRESLSPVRWHDRLGARSARRVGSSSPLQPGSNIALCGRRHRIPLADVGGGTRPETETSADVAGVIGSGKCLVGGRRIRLAS